VILTKHVVYLSILIAFTPMLMRFCINWVNRTVGLAPIPFTYGFVIRCVLAGALIPLGIQSLFEYMMNHNVPEIRARMGSLALLGLLHGLSCSWQPYVNRWGAAIFGIAGACLGGYVYVHTVHNLILQTAVGTMVVLFPVLAIETPGGPIARLIRGHGGVLPIRGYLR
jgi:hypothetical protein